MKHPPCALCFVLLTISIQVVSPSTVVLPATTREAPGGAPRVIGGFYIITQGGAGPSLSDYMCRLWSSPELGSSFSPAVLSGCWVWVKFLSFLNFNFLFWILGRIKVPPQWVAMRIQWKMQIKLLAQYLAHGQSWPCTVPLLLWVRAEKWFYKPNPTVSESPSPEAHNEMPPSPSLTLHLVLVFAPLSQPGVMVFLLTHLCCSVVFPPITERLFHSLLPLSTIFAHFFSPGQATFSYPKKVRINNSENTTGSLAKSA